MSVSVDFTPGDDKVTVNGLGPRRLSITGSGVTVNDDPTHGVIDIVISGGGGGGGSGTVTGLANIGTLGFGIGVGLSGANLTFQNIAANSNKITLTQDNVNNNLKIDVNQTNLSLSSIGGTATWSQVSKTGAVLTDIPNVILTSPTNGQALVYSSGNWINSTISGGGGGGGSVIGVGGSLTKSGDSSTTVFNIPHGLSSTPLIYTASADSRDAASDFFTSANSTNIVITYLFAPPTGTNNLVWNWFALPTTSIYPETKGNATNTGDASTTVFTITHGLGTTPNFVSVIPASADAVGDFYITVNSTIITITYQGPPPSGSTGNLAWWWRTTG